MTAIHLFRRALLWKLVTENPFADVKAGPQTNRARMYFVTRNEADKVLAACPDAQWRLLFALSRYGGLRCPSEHLALRWCDVDWENSRLRVTVSKTEHHEGGDSRFVPLFPELRLHLLDVFSEAEPGSEHVITRYRDVNMNLRTQLLRIIARAGLVPWPKLFQNLRSSRQTELAETYPIHVVCSWIGNSEAVAKDHYLQITDAHFAQAVQEPTPAPVAPNAEAAHIPAQHAAASGSIDLHRARGEGDETPFVQADASPCDSTQFANVGQVGLEPTRPKRDRGF